MGASGEPKVVLGIGRLSWPAEERRGDRYGFVGLMAGATVNKSGPFPEWADPPAPLKLASGKGYLLATVIEARESQHIGDLFRGIRPSTPEVGTTLILGHGTIEFERIAGSGWTIVGLRPDDGRETDWLSPEQLYRVIDQTVELAFLPGERLSNA